MSGLYEEANYVSHFLLLKVQLHSVQFIFYCRALIEVVAENYCNADINYYNHITVMKALVHTCNCSFTLWKK